MINQFFDTSMTGAAPGSSASLRQWWR